MAPAEIRLVLDHFESGLHFPIYWACNHDGDAIRRLQPKEAHNFLRAGVPYTVALNDPGDRLSHYESQSTTFSRV